MRILVLVSVAFLSACVSTSPPSPSRHLGYELFEDIPAPGSALYRDAHSESFSYRSKTFRCARFTYDYPGTESDAARFYQTTMTQAPYGWSAAGEEKTGVGSTLLTFIKHSDRVTVAIDRIQLRASVLIDIRVNYRK